MMKLITTVNSLDEINDLLNAGSDEVVVALKGHCFSALESFELQEISSFEHVSLLMNRLYSQFELEKLDETMQKIASLPIETIYFADPAMLAYAKKYGLLSKMIYRPETLMTNQNDALWWKNRGILGVSISPLLTLQEVLKIAQVDCGAEVTLHGRFLMSVSRRPLLSAYDELHDQKLHLKENRNLTLREMKRDGLMPVFESDFGTLIYTDFIQESFSSAVTFQDSFVKRGFINTVYMSNDEAIATVEAYRQILDGADAEKVKQEYQDRFKEMEMSSGYYGQKTIL